MITRYVFRILCVIYLVFIAGCGPGSSLTQLRVSGTIIKPDNISDTITVTIKQPAEYGLSGLDARWGDAEDYGHSDLFKMVVCDTDGNFSCQFQPITYSVYVMGPIVMPSQPPCPIFLCEHL